LLLEIGSYLTERRASSELALEIETYVQIEDLDFQTSIRKQKWGIG